MKVWGYNAVSLFFAVFFLNDSGVFFRNRSWDTKTVVYTKLKWNMVNTIKIVTGIMFLSFPNIYSLEDNWLDS